MNEFDRFIKQELRVKYYIRYADDFVIMLENKDRLDDSIKNQRKSRIRNGKFLFGFVGAWEYSQG